MVSQYVVGDLFTQADIQADVAEALPPELQLFAGPMVVGLENVADQAVTALIMSEAFNNIWVAFNRVSHTAITDILKGQGNRLYFQDGNLTLDFNDVYNFVQDRLNIGELDLIPQAEQGRLVLFSSQQVAVMQEVVSYLTALGLLLPLLTILVFGAAVWVSLWRRQTVMWIGGVMAVAMLVSLILFSGARSSALVSIYDPFLREMGRAIINNLTHGLMVQTIFLLIVGIGLVIAAWQAAPDSALRQWEASRKKKEEAQESTANPAQIHPIHIHFQGSLAHFIGIALLLRFWCVPASTMHTSISLAACFCSPRLILSSRLSAFWTFLHSSIISLSRLLATPSYLRYPFKAWFVL
jgi:hypothetical protein